MYFWNGWEGGRREGEVCVCVESGFVPSARQKTSTTTHNNNDDVMFVGHVFLMPNGERSEGRGFPLCKRVLFGAVDENRA